MGADADPVEGTCVHVLPVSMPALEDTAISQLSSFVLQLLLGVQAVVTVGIMCHRVHLINVAKQKEAAKK